MERRADHRAVARGMERDKVRGARRGRRSIMSARPFQRRELLARIPGCLRHTARHSHETDDATLQCRRSSRLDLLRGVGMVLGAAEVRLTPIRVQAATHARPLRRKGRHSPATADRDVWGAVPHRTGRTTCAVYMAHLRHKLRGRSCAAALSADGTRRRLSPRSSSEPRRA